MLQAVVGFEVESAAEELVEGGVEVLLRGFEVSGVVVVLAGLVFLLDAWRSGRRRDRPGAPAGPAALVWGSAAAVGRLCCCGAGGLAGRNQGRSLACAAVGMRSSGRSGSRASPPSRQCGAGSPDTGEKKSHILKNLPNSALVGRNCVSSLIGYSDGTIAKFVGSTPRETPTRYFGNRRACYPTARV